jgi:hypothetical protein
MRNMDNIIKLFVVSIVALLAVGMIIITQGSYHADAWLVACGLAWYIKRRAWQRL